MAFAYLSGVFLRPSRFGSSPIHSIIVRMAPHSLEKRSSAFAESSSRRSSVPIPIKHILQHFHEKLGTLKRTRPAQSVGIYDWGRKRAVFSGGGSFDQ